MTLAGTVQTTLVYGSVDFDLTFLNEVTRRHETIFAINAKIIDSCIDIIVSRPVIREYHLVHKFPYYFDEVTRSKPDLSHSILPATPARAIVNCINAIPCAQCPTFFVPGYDINLCALVSEETDHLLVLPDEPRPLAAPFADPRSSEGMHLIAKSEVLGTLEDDDDIEWTPEFVPIEGTSTRQTSY